MSLASLGRRAVNSVLHPFRHQLTPTSLLYDWQIAGTWSNTNGPAEVPEEAKNYLRPENPRLVELRKRYRDFDGAVTTPYLWTEDYMSAEAQDIWSFRGDNAYVWQLRGQNMNPTGYTMSTYYAKSVDALGLLNRCIEDRLFGVNTLTIDGKRISRDLLDSVLEIEFLDRALQVSRSKDFTVLDIGAGYGRLAHRMSVALPNVRRYYCTDAVAMSTFISEFYIRFRAVDNMVNVVPLFDIERILMSDPVDLAVNIHSFSECTLAAIDWWLSMLARADVRYPMIVPNVMDSIGTSLRTNDGQDFAPVVASHGYQLMVKEPKYRDPQVQRYGVNPAYYYLFERPRRSR